MDPQQLMTASRRLYEVLERERLLVRMRVFRDEKAIHCQETLTSYLCMGSPVIDHCDVSVLLLIRDGRGDRILEVSTKEGEQPPQRRPRLKPTYLTHPGGLSLALAHYLQEWSRLANQDLTWESWFQPEAELAVLCGGMQSVHYKLKPSNRTVIGFTGIYEERFAVHADWLKEVLEGGLELTRQLAQDFDELYQRFSSRAAYWRAESIGTIIATATAAA